MCISVAARPSNLGTVLHNAGYEALGLNYLYKAFAVADIAPLATIIRTLGIRGCGVSMPFKESVVPQLDELDAVSRRIGAVNTIVNDSSRLTGYNTDVIGAHAALDSIGATANESVLVLGAGGAARAIIDALRTRGASSVTIASRDTDRAESFRAVLECRIIPWPDRHRQSADVLINATPIGMVPESTRLPIDVQVLSRFRAVFDAVAHPLETVLIREARAAGKAVAPGYVMILAQLAAQFEMYTGAEPPMDVLHRALQSLHTPNEVAAGGSTS